MDPETKKAAEYCQIAGVGHVVASKPKLKPIERYRPEERLPENMRTVLTDGGLAFVGHNADQWYGLLGLAKRPTWWAYLPEGDE